MLTEIISAALQGNTQGLGKWINGHLNNFYSLMTLIGVVFLIGGDVLIVTNKFFSENGTIWLLSNTIVTIIWIFIFGILVRLRNRRDAELQEAMQLIQEMSDNPTTIKIQTTIISKSTHPKKRVELIVQKDPEGYVATLLVGTTVYSQVLIPMTS